MQALSPVPDAVARRVGAMDVVELGALSAALIRGPYQRMERA